MDAEGIFDLVDEETGNRFLDLLLKAELLSWAKKPYDEAKGLMAMGIEGARRRIRSIGAKKYIEDMGAGQVKPINLGSELANYRPRLGNKEFTVRCLKLAFLARLDAKVEGLDSMDRVTGVIGDGERSEELTLKDLYRELGFWVLDGSPDGQIKMVGGGIVDQGEPLLTVGYNYFKMMVLHDLAMDYLQGVDHRIVSDDSLAIGLMLGDIVVKEGGGDPDYLRQPDFLERIFRTSDRKSLSGAQVLARFARLRRIEEGDASLIGLDSKAVVARLGGKEGIINFAVSENKFVELGMRLRQENSFRNTALAVVKYGMDLVMGMVEKKVGGDWERIKTLQFLDGPFSLVNETGRDALTFILSCSNLLLGETDGQIIATPQRIAELSTPEEMYEGIMQARGMEVALVRTGDIQEALVLFYDAYFYELEASPERIIDFSYRLKSGRTMGDIMMELAYWNNKGKIPVTKEGDLDPLSQMALNTLSIINVVETVVEDAQVDYLRVWDDYNGLHIFMAYQAAIYGKDFYSKPEFNDKAFTVEGVGKVTGRELLPRYLKLRQERKGDVPSMEDLGWLGQDASLGRWIGYITKSPLKSQIRLKRERYLENKIQLISENLKNPEELRNPAVHAKIVEQMPASTKSAVMRGDKVEWTMERQMRIEDVFGNMVIAAALLGLEGFEPRLATLTPEEALNEAGGIDAVIRLVKGYAKKPK